MNDARTLPSPGLVWGGYPEDRLKKDATWPRWLAGMHAVCWQPINPEAERCLRRLRPALAAL
ncbi:MAG TPA: hypothetical protein VJT77_05985, partial [Burkholderiales bacterium]|nr:hypothetical protein [Burkholderiales bacterium]